MNWEKLLDLYQNHNPELENNCFFSAVIKIDELGPIITGMANTIGGTLSIGMDFKNVHLRGSNVTEDLIRDTLENFFSAPIHFDYSEVLRGGKAISVLEVKKSANKPVYYKDICYVYRNDSLFTANAEEEELMRHETRSIHRTIDNPEEEPREVEQESYFLPERQAIQESAPVEIVAETSPETETEYSAHPYPTIVHSETDFTIKKAVETSNELTQKSETSFSPNYGANETGFPRIPHPQETLETLEEFIIHLNKRQRKALKYLKENKSIKNKIYRKIGAVSHKTAHIELTEMLQYGLIRSQGNGRSTHYVLNR